LDPNDQGAIRLDDQANIYAMFDDREDNLAGNYEAWVVGYQWLNGTGKPVHHLIQCDLEPAKGGSGKLFCKGDGGYVKFAWYFYPFKGYSLAMSNSRYPPSCGPEARLSWVNHKLGGI